MKNDSINKMSGHWLLAKVGKKVLRPGGKQATKQMIELLAINEEDKVVEFAPGLGYTTNLTINNNPKSFTGIDLEPNIVNDLKAKFESEHIKFELANAAETGIESDSKTKIYGEAMLTMHANHRKSEIIKEAYRILETNGLYAIHELALRPNNISENIKKEIQRELAEVMKVNARPLTIDEWQKLLADEGFKIITTETKNMNLLNPLRIIDDEGVKGFLTIIKNINTQPEIKARVLQMKNIFKKYEKYLCAIIIIAKKNNQIKDKKIF